MLMQSHWTSGGQITSYSHRLKRIGSFPNFWEGEQHFTNLERDAPRWVLVLWGQSKYHISFNVFIRRQRCTFIGHLGPWSCSTAIASSASDHFPFFWVGELHLSNLERVTPRWVFVLWGWSKYHNSSNVFIWHCCCNLIGRLGYGSHPTAVASSASDCQWE